MDSTGHPTADRRLKAPEPYEVWAVALDRATAPDALATLASEERTRAARLVFARDRGRYLAAHAALRRLLAARTGIAAEALQFTTGPFGKPFLSPPPACSFNLSHSEDLALVALAPGGEIGVDVERLRAVPDALALAERHYTAAERAALQRAGAAGRDRAFLTGWTRKEACLKAIGSGFSIEALAVDAGLDAELRIVAVATAAGAVAVEVQSLPDDGRWVGALARVVER